MGLFENRAFPQYHLLCHHFPCNIARKKRSFPCFFKPCIAHIFRPSPMAQWFFVDILEVRSIQEAEGSEKIMVVFSSGVESWKTKSQWQGSASREKVCKVKMYVEAMEYDPQP